MDACRRLVIKSLDRLPPFHLVSPLQLNPVFSAAHDVQYVQQRGQSDCSQGMSCSVWQYLAFEVYFLGVYGSVVDYLQIICSRLGPVPIYATLIPVRASMNST